MYNTTDTPPRSGEGGSGKANLAKKVKAHIKKIRKLHHMSALLDDLIEFGKVPKIPVKNYNYRKWDGEMFRDELGRAKMGGNISPLTDRRFKGNKNLPKNYPKLTRKDLNPWLMFSEFCVLLDDLIQFGSLGPQRNMRRILALQKKGIGVTRITSGDIAETTIRPASPAQQEYFDRLRNQLTEKAHSAIRRKNPNRKSNKVDPNYDRTGGRGWERLYSQWVSGSDENTRRAMRAAGWQPKPPD